VAIFKHLKTIKDQVTAGLSATGPTPEQLAALSPEQRAAYEARLAEVAAAQREVDQIHQQQMDDRPLLGPAGTHLYGPDPRDTARAVQDALATGGVAASIKASWTATGPTASRPTLPVDVVSHDPVEQRRHEWAGREAARAPYLAPGRFPVVFTRIATRAATQFPDVTAHLASSGLATRPELVFGVYPVPDHIGHGLGREKNRYLEWDVVHAATAPLPAAAAPGSTFLPGDVTWVTRPSGAPSVLDEDLGVTLLASAGLGPEHCLGIARAIRTWDRSGGEDTTGYTAISVLGAVVFGPSSFGDRARDLLAGAAPMALPTGSPAGVHTEVLNWGAVARAVHPDTQRPAPVPSPFAYLPGTAQELLRSYLDIVGVNPFDCYGASVTEDGVRNLRASRTSGWIQVTTNTSTSLPCVDGTARMRMHGGSLIVVTYRDRPEYRAGRERWSAYQRAVLQAQLQQGTGARRPVSPMAYGSLGRGTRRLIGLAERAADLASDLTGDVSTDEVGDPVPHRYCWPPTDIR
jgi:hypothetical protein